MTADHIATIVEARFVCGESNQRLPLDYGFASDLMSDILTLTQENVLFITGLVAPQTIRTALVSDIHTILIVRGKTVPGSIVDLARENGLTILASAYSMFRASGELYKAGLRPIF